MIALPALEGPGIAGLPSDAEGFIPIDERARVKGVEDVYAAGDGTTFPIKQGGLATQQADAAAEHIAARFGADIDPQPFHPVLRGMLLTGDDSLSLAHSLTGGEGEGSASADYLWWPPHKVSGRYLAPWMAGGRCIANRSPRAGRWRSRWRCRSNGTRSPWPSIPTAAPRWTKRRVVLGAVIESLNYE